MSSRTGNYSDLQRTASSFESYDFTSEGSDVSDGEGEAGSRSTGRDSPPVASHGRTYTQRMAKHPTAFPKSRFLWMIPILIFGIGAAVVEALNIAGYIPNFAGGLGSTIVHGASWVVIPSVAAVTGLFTALYFQANSNKRKIDNLRRQIDEPVRSDAGQSSATQQTNAGGERDKGKEKEHPKNS